ncbi:hypothetical protein TNCV_3747431 [Trichonephila clavipes]|nr:hypothetical protein TNCV_3747431 [Trichonephila clavipes]
MRNGRFYTTSDPKEHQQLGNHHNLHEVENSTKIAQKGRSYERCSSMFIVLQKIIPEGCIVSTKTLCRQLRRLRESIRKKRPKLWAEQSLVLLHDNASTHRSLVVFASMSMTRTTVPTSYMSFC